MNIKIMADGIPAIILPQNILIISKKDLNFRRLLRSTYRKYSNAGPVEFSELSLEPTYLKSKESEPSKPLSSEPVNISNLFNESDSTKK